MKSKYNAIKTDIQIWKFCFYGFFKNLKFFEPYLLIYLMGMGLNLFQVGVLLSIREGITYIFEVPSGILADHYGKKKELLLCFIFYIISFVFFFWGKNFAVLSVGMVFFGLGEAFRSGTHKAMILSYLEHKGWYEHKGYVYGRTRSYSLLGSSLSAFLSILLVLNLPALRWVFLVSIVPYVLDFILIVSYPQYLDERNVSDRSFVAFWRASTESLKSISRNTQIRKIVMSAASYDGVFKTIKDYIQPILSTIVLAAGIGSIMSFEGDQSVKIYLGLIYGVFYIFSSQASKNIYRVTKRFTPEIVFDKMYDIMGILLLVLAFSIFKGYLLVTIGIYFTLFLMMDSRRPVFVDVSSDFMKRDQRVTVLSIESQIRALLMIVMAPLFGWIADAFSLTVLFLIIGIVLLIANRFLSVKRN